ncbi:MAG: hypothetical protein HYS17_08360 [Micavibrio aeruginosavorus]|uniref:SH3b domain-containing protein n=1 Tax=Micavibrio aeruginosavorus TaxID=349221 RepID=A0A7T5UHL1_9BACT|nr:MAG: hypothetical protein HYS17_08360 [Micavibrio aeruginosavorus]
MRLFSIILFLVLISFSSRFAQAQDAVGDASGAYGAAIKTSGLPLPRFVSLKSDKVYVRTGPSVRYPIRWIYQKADMPVEIIEEFDVWRKIRDSEGEGGWVSQTLLSGERTVLIKGDDLAPVREKPEEKARMVARLESGVIAKIDECHPAWCKVSAGGFKGWISRNSLWGIYENEEVN